MQVIHGGPDYYDHGALFSWENGKPPHPDMITRRLKRLAKAADPPETDLHDAVLVGPPRADRPVWIRSPPGGQTHSQGRGAPCPPGSFSPPGRMAAELSRLSSIR